ncbi:peptide ABC transporter permease [Rhodococcus sp. WS1]|uniref:ABC transporter permease n=1 Tax=Rhodococcus TaxID=1827 RepID=UPI001143D9E9|nr:MULTISPECIES: ABC transporter permease [Rhodococcus]MCQ4124451.1 ABC transporter permease [Rhodococcus erythropolis]ROZ59561.1 peptide ABC transporter permease [Rhodococcus sp. WS1]TQC34839.1 peptide ABC transporter permease [Rhodococcus sp. WS7]
MSEPTDRFMAVVRPVEGFNFPYPDNALPESSFKALVVHSGIQAKRLLLTWLRDPSTAIQALIYPAFMLLMFRVVLGNSITAATGQSSIFGTVPLIILVGAMFGSIASAVGLKGERASGLLSRFWTLPAHRASGLVGRMIAEAVRVLLTSIVILGVGYLLGFRFNQGPLAAFAILALPVIFGVGFAMMVTALATVSDNLPLVEIVSISCTLLMFFNSGFVPVMAYPKWLQPVVAEQPMSVAIDTMRGLSLGGPVAEPLVKTLLWSFGMILVFVYPAIRGYRRAAAMS